MQKFIGFDSFETKWLNAGGADVYKRQVGNTGRY